MAKIPVTEERPTEEELEEETSEDTIEPEEGVVSTEHGLISDDPDYLAHEPDYLVRREPFEGDYLLEQQEVIDEEEIIEIEGIVANAIEVSTVPLLLTARCIAQRPEEGVLWSEIWQETGFSEKVVDKSVRCLEENGLIAGLDKMDDDWGTEKERFYSREDG